MQQLRARRLRFKLAGGLDLTPTASANGATLERGGPCCAYQCHAAHTLVVRGVGQMVLRKA